MVIHYFSTRKAEVPVAVVNTVLCLANCNYSQSGVKRNFWLHAICTE